MERFVERPCVLIVFLVVGEIEELFTVDKCADEIRCPFECVGVELVLGACGEAFGRFLSAYGVVIGCAVD